MGEPSGPEASSSGAGSGPGAGAAEGAADGAHRRDPRNYVLDAGVQVRLGAYSTFLGGLFALGLLGILNAGLTRMYEQVLDLTPHHEAVREVVRRCLGDTAIYAGALAVVFVVGSVLVSVLYTHRLVGPTIAFRRHLRALIEGRYGTRTRLREHDAFVEVAADLNELAEVLQRRHGAAP